jgi:D-arabinose 1-dehydrogenase-like Zn-dependent alcohol dehydrogenase
LQLFWFCVASIEDVKIGVCIGVCIGACSPINWLNLTTTGTGGVSLMALRLARAAGCKVIITSSSDVKLSGVQQLESSGAISTINYRTNPIWGQEALRLNAE